MLNKLTIQNLNILNTINNDGQSIRTPEPSEISEVKHELKYMYLLADRLLWASTNHKITTKKYMLWLNILIRCQLWEGILEKFAKSELLSNVAEQLRFQTYCSSEYN